MGPSALCGKIRERIRKSDLWNSRSKETGTHFYGLRCPECGKAEAWAYTDGPFTILCNRKNECGARTRTLDLFPDILVAIEKEYAPTKKDPHRPAREYLHSRGLDRSLKGLAYEYWPKIRGLPTGGVMFPLGKNSTGESVWNGRLFNPPEGEGKTHNKGSTAGMIWRHPGLKYDPGQPTYLTEAILEALSLIEMGYQAAAALSAGQDPAAVDLGPLAERLVIAFNPDRAGGDGLKKWKKAFPNAGAITPVSGDWNDFLRNHAPDQARKAFNAALPEFACRADLILSQSARDYASVWYDFYGRAPGLFAWEGCYYYSQEKETRKGPEITAARVSNFTLHVDHYQLDSSAEDEPVYRYCVQVKPKGGKPTFCSLTGTELSTPAAIRATMLTRARVMWEGEARPTSAFTRMIVDSQAPTVRQVHILGHDLKSGCSVFRDFLIDSAGKVGFPDKKGFFRASAQEFLRPPAIQTVRPKRGTSPKRIYELMQAAWPDNGALAFAFTVASWFVNSVKPELGFFPFLSLHGDTQTGKTRLVRTMNAMQALDEEGLPMTKLNTGKGEIRKLAQRSGLFKALLEGNKEDKLRFDLESLLTLYNYGNHLQVRATKSNDIQTHETGFLASIVFVQNREPFKSKAQMERVISSRPFRADDITRETTAAFNDLVKIPLREIAYCYPAIMAHRRDIEAQWPAGYTAAREEIVSAILDNRLAENHAVILAFHRMLSKILKLDHDLKPFILEITQRKHDLCTRREATLADSFFEACNELTEPTRAKFVEFKDGRMMVKLALGLKTLDGHGYRFIQSQVMHDLREHPAYVASRVGYRGYFDSEVSESTRVWVFDAMKIL